MHHLFKQQRQHFTFRSQSLRLATTPFPDWLEAGDLGAVTQIVKGWQTAGITYLSLGPVQIQHDAHNIHLLHEIIAMNDAVFGSVEVADQNGRIAFAEFKPQPVSSAS